MGREEERVVFRVYHRFDIGMGLFVEESRDVMSNLYDYYMKTSIDKEEVLELENTFYYRNRVFRRE
jgi:hypothetical protein